MSAALIVQSFERASELCPDLTPLVYQRLFREEPGLEEFFVLDRTGAVKGNMLSWLIRSILDFVGDRAYGQNLIQAEALHHDGYGVSKEQFARIFGTLARTLEDILGDEWASYSAAWSGRIADLDRIVVEAGQ